MEARTRDSDSMKHDSNIQELFEAFSVQLRSFMREELHHFLQSLPLSAQTRSCTSSYADDSTELESVTLAKKKPTEKIAKEVTFDDSVSLLEDFDEPSAMSIRQTGPKSTNEPCCERDDFELWYYAEEDDMDVMHKHNVIGHRVSTVLAGHRRDPASGERPGACQRSDDSRSLRRRTSNEEKWSTAVTHPFMPKAIRHHALMSMEDDGTWMPNDGRECTDLSLSAISMDRQEHTKKSAFAHFILSLEFDQCIGFLVVLNACSIGLETNHQAVNIGEELPLAYKLIDAFFCVAFTSELLMKFSILGCSAYFCGDNAAWQVFDLLVVGLQLADYFLKFAVPHQNGQRSVVMHVTIFRLLRLLRMARVLRILRIVRTFRLIDDLDTIVTSIAASMKSLFWALLVLSIMIYVVAICFTHVVTDARKELSDGQEIILEDLVFFFGSLWRSVLTMFQCIAEGMQWGEVFEPLSQHVSPWAGVLFIAYVAFSVFAMLNVVTGVFVDKAMACANSKEDDKLIGYLRTLFLMADERGVGEITWEEFESSLHSEEMKEYFRIIDVDISEAHSVFSLIDADGSGCVDPLEFVSGCLRLRGGAKAVELSLLMYETKKMNHWLKTHIHVLEHRVTWIGNLLKHHSAKKKGVPTNRHQKFSSKRVSVGIPSSLHQFRLPDHVLGS